MRSLLLAALLAAPAAAKDFVHKEARFSCSAPTGWKLQARGKASAAWAGPKPEQGPAPRISVEFRDEDAAAYLKSRTAPAKGVETGPVTETKVAGRGAKTFTRRLVKFLPPHSLDARSIVVIEERIVVPAGKGVHILSFAAPEAVFEESRPAFRRVVDTFKPSP